LWKTKNRDDSSSSGILDSTLLQMPANRRTLGGVCQEIIKGVDKMLDAVIGLPRGGSLQCESGKI